MCVLIPAPLVRRTQCSDLPLQAPTLCLAYLRKDGWFRARSTPPLRQLHSLSLSSSTTGANSLHSSAEISQKPISPNPLRKIASAITTNLGRGDVAKRSYASGVPSPNTAINLLTIPSDPQSSSDAKTCSTNSNILPNNKCKLTLNL